jgi:transcriptional regulator with XRE-family HTH domain
MTNRSSDPSEPLHGLIARLRSERQLSIARLAAATGLSPNAVRWIERGITQPKPESLRALAGALDVPYELLLQKAGYLEQTLQPNDEREVIDLYRALTPDRKLILRQLLQALGTPPTPADGQAEAAPGATPPSP